MTKRSSTDIQNMKDSIATAYQARAAGGYGRSDAAGAALSNIRLALG
jgi:hypothetical protein